MGPNLPRPYADLLTDGIHELRVKLSGDEVRILYFFCFREFIVLTHSFIKRTRKVPQSEIDQARKYQADFLNRFDEDKLRRQLMQTFRGHLEEKLKNERFQRLYEEERELAELSLKILEIRQQMGLSQKEVAKRANITQQQLSRVESGINCNMSTFLRICHALDLTVGLVPLQLI
jgi:DNA-binding XRE family transcriptional regulator